MPAIQPSHAAQATGRSPSMRLLGVLRPELAAFFALPARELTARRVAAEQGILAELRSLSGSD
jgi:hypothetical protein